VNCGTCLFKTRPYPRDNPTRDRRGAICLPCNKKFLYRDVKHELTIKLEVRDEQVKGTPEELDDEELIYNRMMNELRNLKEAKLNSLEMMRDMTTPGHHDTEEAKMTSQLIQAAVVEKDHLLEELQVQQGQLEKVNQRIEKFQEDLVKM
jgi:hypothetical protein